MSILLFETKKFQIQSSVAKSYTTLNLNVNQLFH